MIQRTGKPSFALLVFLAVCSIVLFYLAEKSQTPLKSDYYDQKIKAAQLAQKAQELVRNELSLRGYAIDAENDPNLTGLIGPQYSLITTDRSSLRDKLISTNPNLAAVMVDYFKRANLVEGDVIAVFFSGSFPGANIAVLAACKILGLKPIIITSVGASSFGANRDEFTWLDMENIFVVNGIWEYKSVAASLGGGNDEGRGLSPRGRQLLEEAIKRNNVELITTPQSKSPADALQKNIDRRISIIDRERGERELKAVVNVGGGLAAVGSAQNARLIPPGYSASLRGRQFPARGAINILAQRRLPVIHILDLSAIAEKNGLPVDLTGEPEIGEGPIFIKHRYSVVSTAIYTLILLLIVILAIRLDLRYFIVKNRHLFVRKT